MRFETIGDITCREEYEAPHVEVAVDPEDGEQGEDACPDYSQPRVDDFPRGTSRGPLAACDVSAEAIAFQASFERHWPVLDPPKVRFNVQFCTVDVRA